MKRLKRMASLILALALALVLAVPAMAAETYSITINNSAEGHTYEAYQIFTGDLSGTTLSNIVWGSGISEDGKNDLGNAATKAGTLNTEADAKAFAKGKDGWPHLKTSGSPLASYPGYPVNYVLPGGARRIRIRPEP